MSPAVIPAEDPCPRAAPLIERALRDHGWADIQLTCRDRRLHIAARCPDEPVETPQAHFVLGSAVLAALATTSTIEDAPDSP